MSFHRADNLNINLLPRTSLKVIYTSLGRSKPDRVKKGSQDLHQRQGKIGDYHDGWKRECGKRQWYIIVCRLD